VAFGKRISQCVTYSPWLSANDALPRNADEVGVAIPFYVLATPFYSLYAFIDEVGVGTPLYPLYRGMQYTVTNTLHKHSAQTGQGTPGNVWVFSPPVYCKHRYIPWVGIFLISPPHGMLSTSSREVVQKHFQTGPALPVPGGRWLPPSEAAGSVFRRRQAAWRSQCSPVQTSADDLPQHLP
jgi:hypothetical protein